MKYTSEMALLCRELFFQTGEIGYYVLAKKIEDSLIEENDLTL